MRIALFTDAFPDRDLRETLEWLGAHAPSVRDLEIGTGGYSPAPHCDLAELVADGASRRRWLEAIESRGYRIAALNVSGNPLHPDRSLSRTHDEALRATLRLAREIGVTRVVAMSGCPGAEGTPIFSGGGWLPDLVGIAQRQWEEIVEPYWRDLLADAGREAPGVKLCLELHPGTFVYNTATFTAIAELGQNVAVNLDPSHFFWQSIDPFAVIEALGPRIGHAHAKDVRVDERNRALNGVLDNRWPGEAAQMPWTFATVGRAHDAAWWASFAAALEAAGADVATLSIEIEDPFATSEESVVESVAVLEEAMAGRG
jgi:sugar phosphate isomerase/epimerase